MVPDTRKPVEPAYYELYGVLHHHGQSAGGRHYRVDVLYQNGDDSDGEIWRHVNDEILSAVRYEDVSGVHKDQREDDWCAYYKLFYCHTASART